MTDVLAIDGAHLLPIVAPVDQLPLVGDHGKGLESSPAVVLDDFLGNELLIDSVFYGRRKVNILPIENSQNGKVTLYQQPQGGLGV